MRLSRSSTPRHGSGLRRVAAVAGLAAALTLSACAGDGLSSGGYGGGEGDSDASADGGPVNIVSQDFPSANIVTEMYALVLEDAGYQPDTQFVGSRDVYMADGQFPGQIDIVPEYVGAIANYLNIQENGPEAEPLTETDADAMTDAAADLVEAQGITLLEASEATDANAYFVTEEFAETNELETLSDLGELGEPVVLAAAPDCEGRADCEGGLSEEYGIDITKVLPLGFASTQTYEAVLSGEAQLGQTSTIDGSLESQGLVLLEDDKEIQPAQNLVPAVSTEFLDANPEVADVLEELMGTLSSDDLTELTAQVTVERARAGDVARQYLEDEGLI